MSQHHPDSEVLMEFASGRLPTAAGLTVAAHCECCEPCSRAIAAVAELCGALLSRLPGQPMPAALAPPEPPVRDSPAGPPRRGNGDPLLPLSLADVGLKPKRPLGLGFWMADTKASTEHDWRSFLLVVPPGGQVPSHRHVGEEYIAVLEGEFSDGRHDYRAGDFVYSADQSRHGLRAGEVGRCVCLIAIQSPVKWDGPWMRLMRFWTGL